MILTNIQKELQAANTQLVAVSKTHPNEKILELYEEGQRDFGENKVQELGDKYESLPKDIRWHFIGHLQTNKVKYIAPYIHLIHSVDSRKVLKEINKRALQNDRPINGLLQFKIAKEDSKYGLTLEEGKAILEEEYANMEGANIVGVMGMATFTYDQDQVRSEFQQLKSIFDQLKANYFNDDPSFKEISMGMSGDYQLAVEEGSTMVRVGSLLFGNRK
jgi:pyridoxal phosphate enzyme (YggS family)